MCSPRRKRDLHRLGVKPHREGIIRFVFEKVALVVLSLGRVTLLGLNYRGEKSWGTVWGEMEGLAS